ncbi:MAG: hypothetical protein AAF919_09190 [Pseudomonadota bacterium]
MIPAALFLIIGPFMAGILACSFFGVLFGRRGVWPSATIVMISIAYGVFRWTTGCLGNPLTGVQSDLICDAPLEAFSAIAVVLIGLPLACLMVAAAAIVMERILAETDGPVGRSGKGRSR